MSPDPVPVTPAATKANDALGEIIQVATEAKPPTVPSPPGSMKGWSWRVLLAKQKDKLKIVISALGGYLTLELAGIKDPNLAAAVATAIGIAVYVASAAVDYMLTANPN